MDRASAGGDELRISRPRASLDEETLERLTRGLEACPDVAFAHLPEAFVPGRQERPELVLFVWLVPRALRSLRSAVNLVAEVVAGALEESAYLDIVVLNSAPELLPEIERAGCLIVERDPEERRRAVEAAHAAEPETPPRRRRWWGGWA